MSNIRTKPTTEKYRKGWEKIFGKKKPKARKIIYIDTEKLTTTKL